MKSKVFTVLFLLFLAHPHALAADISSGQWLEAFAVLVGILALILALAWFLKRTRVGGSGFGQVIKILAVHPLGYKEKILVVRIGQEQLVLGVCPQRITFLCKLEQPLDTCSDAFSGQLGKAISAHAQSSKVGSSSTTP